MTALLLAALVAAPASQGLIEASLQSFRAGDYEAALIGFEKAYEASPDQPRLLWNIGRCQEELGKTKDALASFERYLEIEVDDSQGIRDALTKVAKLRSASKPKSATLRVETTPRGARVFVDGEPVGKAPVLVEAPAGDHVITAKLKGRMPAETQVAAVAGQAALISLALPELPRAAPTPTPTPAPQAPPPPERRWLTPTALGVAGVLLTALAVHAFLDATEHDDAAITARAQGEAGALSDAAAAALASDAEDRAALHGLLGWTFSAGAAAALGGASWSILRAD